MRPAVPPSPRGFTLIELLVALVVAALLACAAMPSFWQQLQRSRRGDAQQGLARIALAQERYRGLHAGYASELGALDALGGAAASRHYDFELVGLGEPPDFARGYTVHARPRAGGLQAGDAACPDIVLEVRDGAARRLDGPRGTAPPRDVCWPP